MVEVEQRYVLMNGLPKTARETQTGVRDNIEGSSGLVRCPSIHHMGELSIIRTPVCVLGRQRMSFTPQPPRFWAFFLC